MRRFPIHVFSPSQIPNSRPDPVSSFSFLQLSWFEWRKISNGSNRAVRNAPSFQAAFSTTVYAPRSSTALRNNSFLLFFRSSVTTSLKCSSEEQIAFACLLQHLSEEVLRDVPRQQS